MSDSLRFAGARRQAQGKYLAALANSHTVPEVVEAQSEFTRRAVADYGSQVGRIPPTGGLANPSPIIKRIGGHE